MVFFKQDFTPFMSHSQKPPPLNNKIPCNLLIGRILVYCCSYHSLNINSLEQYLKCCSYHSLNINSLEQYLKVLALSEKMTVGTPLQVQKCLKTNKKAVAESSPVTSKCSAHVDVHVHKQMYALLSCPSLSCTYKGPAKSMPTLLNGDCTLTHSSRSEVLVVIYI